MKKTKKTDKVTDLQNRLARSLADYANLEKRIDRDRQMIATLASIAIIGKMIEVLDDLYLSYNHLKDQGLKMTIDKFVSVLKSEGLEEIVAASKTFDPATMECVGSRPGKENIVLSVEKKGYTLNGQVIRPAQVIVGQATTNLIINS